MPTVAFSVNAPTGLPAGRQTIITDMSYVPNVRSWTLKSVQFSGARENNSVANLAMDNAPALLRVYPTFLSDNFHIIQGELTSTETVPRISDGVFYDTALDVNYLGDGSVYNYRAHVSKYPDIHVGCVNVRNSIVSIDIECFNTSGNDTNDLIRFVQVVFEYNE